LNFDVAVRNSFMVAAVVITDHEGIILYVNGGEATVALLAMKTNANLSSSSSQILLEGVSLGTIIALNHPCLSAEWSSAPIIANTISRFFVFPS
jgi:hypothetical protein